MRAQRLASHWMPRRERHSASGRPASGLQASWSNLQRPRGLMLIAVLVSACGGSGPEGATTTDPSSPSSSSAASVTTPFQAIAPADLYVQGGVEYYEWLAGCATENGAVVEVDYGNPPGVGWTTNPRTAEIVARCRETALAEGWIIASPFDGSAEGNRLMYRLWMPVHECLASNGYPTVDPPSEQAFVDQGSELWNPYAGFAVGTPLSVADPATARPGELEQLEAQELCGASAAILYQEEIGEQQTEGAPDEP